eukprot:107015_1
MKKKKPRWYDIYNENTNKQTEGSVYIGIELIDLNMLHRRANRIFTVDKNVALAGQSNTIQKNIRQQEEEEEKSKYLHKTTEQLQITIVNAQNVPAMDSGRSDSFVEIAVNGQTQKTSVQKNTLTPTWNETLILNGISVHDSMSIQLNDLNRFGQKK